MDKFTSCCEYITCYGIKINIFTNKRIPKKIPYRSSAHNLQIQLADALTH